MKRLGWILLGFLGCLALIYLVRRLAEAKEEVIEEERGIITLTQRAFMPLEERTPTIRAYEPIPTPTPTPISPISPTQDVYQPITPTTKDRPTPTYTYSPYTPQSLGAQMMRYEALARFYGEKVPSPIRPPHFR